MTAAQEISGQNGWVIHPSLRFDAMCLVPLLAELPFCTARPEQDAWRWQERFAAVAGSRARDAVSVLRRAVAEQGGKPLPAFLAARFAGRDPAAGTAVSTPRPPVTPIPRRRLAGPRGWPRDLAARHRELTENG